MDGAHKAHKGEGRGRVATGKKGGGCPEQASRLVETRGSAGDARCRRRDAPLFYEKMNIARKASAATHMSGFISRTLRQASMHTT